MATVQSGNSPGGRIATGDAILAAAKVVNLKPIQKRYNDFKKVHLSYSAAVARVDKATAALTKQQEKVADTDVGQDDSVEDLAAGLVADGFPRVNPFKDFGAPPPAALCRMGYGDEAEKVLDLEKAVLKNKRVSAATQAKAKKAGAAARKVQAEIKPIARLEKARTDARSTRDALEQSWQTAFASLKLAARAAENDGAKGIFGALFERAPKPVKSKGKKAEGETAKAKGKAAKGEAKPEPAKPEPAKPAPEPEKPVPAKPKPEPAKPEPEKPVPA